jgi:hypothetical protein
MKLWKSASWHRVNPLQESSLHTAGNPVEFHVKIIRKIKVGGGLIKKWHKDIILLHKYKIYSFLHYHKHYWTISIQQTLALRYSSVLASWYSIGFPVQHRLHSIMSNPGYLVSILQAKKEIIQVALLSGWILQSLPLERSISSLPSQ